MRTARTLLLAALTTSACGADPEFSGEVPTNPDALIAWLEAESYADWEKEPNIHTTTAPHGSHVRTYVNLPLAGSLENGNQTHVVESATVKEIYDKGLVVGWAVMVKTEPGPDASSWYFYELLDRTSRDDVLEGHGLGVCAGCHSAGVDHIRTQWPPE